MDIYDEILGVICSLVGMFGNMVDVVFNDGVDLLQFVMKFYVEIGGVLVVMGVNGLVSVIVQVFDFLEFNLNVCCVYVIGIMVFGIKVFVV